MNGRNINYVRTLRHRVGYCVRQPAQMQTRKMKIVRSLRLNAVWPMPTGKQADWPTVLWWRSVPPTQSVDHWKTCEDWPRSVNGALRR